MSAPRVSIPADARVLESTVAWWCDRCQKEVGRDHAPAGQFGTPIHYVRPVRRLILHTAEATEVERTGDVEPVAAWRLALRATVAEFDRRIMAIERAVAALPVAERVAKVEEHLDTLALGHDNIRRTLDNAGGPFQSLAHRFDGMNARFVRVERRVDALEQPQEP